MHQRVKKRRGKKEPLSVKEIILPVKPDNDQATGRTNLWPNVIEVLMEKGCYMEPAGSCVKVGNHDVKQVVGLVNLEKKPLENYFEGTRQKKQTRKRKVMCQTVIPASELFSDGGLSSSKVNICDTQKLKQTEKLLAEEETEMKLLHLKIYKCEKMRQSAVEKNHAKQAMAEKNYIQQLEYFAEKWFGMRQRKGRLKHTEKPDVKDSAKYSQGTTPKKFGIFATQRKEWNDNTKPSYGESEKVKETLKGCQPVQTLLLEDDLKDDFFEKLVFIDEESDDSECGFQNSQIRRNLRKVTTTADFNDGNPSFQHLWTCKRYEMLLLPLIKD